MKVLKSLVVGAVVILSVAFFWFCQTERKPTGVGSPTGEPVALQAPLGLPPIAVPMDNPGTRETIALGRRLFYDPILSADGSTSCATCHKPELGFSSGRSVPTQTESERPQRCVPSLLNVAYNTEFYWDGRAHTLEEQVERHLQDPLFMNHSLEQVEKKLAGDPSYLAQFKAAFASEAISHQMVAKALAAFERTLLCGNSPFDRWHYGRDESAVTAAVKHGFEVFRDPAKGNCASCHTVGEQFALFTDLRFHNVGSSVNLKGEIEDKGRQGVTKRDNDAGSFKTPSLRNIALTRPYFHQGELDRLKDAVDFFIGGCNSNPNLDKNIHSLGFLTGKERVDLLAFLESLTGEMPANTGSSQ